jgi:hypothetical protein
MPRVCYPQKQLFRDIALVSCPGVHLSLLMPTSYKEKKYFLSILLYGYENKKIETDLVIFKCIKNDLFFFSFFFTDVIGVQQAIFAYYGYPELWS